MHYNEQAERSVIGAMILQPKNITRVNEFISKDDFYLPAHKHIYDAIMRLKDANEHIDVITVANKVKELGKLESIGGSAAITDIIARSEIGDTTIYAKIVQTESVKRDIQLLGMMIADDKQEEPGALLSKIEEHVYKLSRKGAKRKYQSLYEGIEGILSRFGADKAIGIQSNFKVFDKLTGGFRNSDMVIIGARPSMGKTSIMINFAYNVAKQGYSVGILSLEMTYDQIVDRFVALESKVSVSKIRQGIFDGYENERIKGIRAEASKLKLHIEDANGYKLHDVKSSARKMKDEEDIDILFIDYAQMIGGADGKDTVAQYTEIATGIKMLAKELNIPIVILSQLNRESDKTVSGIPRLGQLRDTGAWEQVADIVSFIHRFDYQKELKAAEASVVFGGPTIEMEANENKAALIIAKHRNGPTGEVPLRFVPELSAFEEV